MNILVIGAGLGGLSAAIALARQGHTVQVLEQASSLREVGGGIQIPPNATRILLDWGLEAFLVDQAVEPEGITIRRWQNGEPIGYTRLIPDFRIKYHAPYYVAHRSHLHEALYKMAVHYGAEVLVNHRVVAYDEDEPSVTLADGQKMYANFIVAADGIKSIARGYIPGEARNPQPYYTGVVAYRTVVDVAKIQADPDTAWILDRPSSDVWIGHNRHVMTYTISSGTKFNMVLSRHDTDPATWSQQPPGDVIMEMRESFRDWDPRLVKLIDMVDETMKWPLMANLPLQRWRSRSSKLILIGDAAHAMVPYMSQGAAMAIEDAAALAQALLHAPTLDQIPYVLSVYEKIRAPRTSQMSQASTINGKILNLPDGPEQEARDRGMRTEVLPCQPFRESPNQWSDPITQAWAYGYDALGEIEKALSRLW